jgi:hypothetical protein
VARAKKGRAVPNQCADWIFASGRAAAFYLAIARLEGNAWQLIKDDVLAAL